MRLDQLGLTAGGKSATKKLAHQVHKATVAAAMEPKLRLGVVGIEIGQEQSTGPTSRINEAAASIDDMVRLVRKLAKTLKFRQQVGQDLPASNDEELWKCAIMIGRHYDDADSSGANSAWDIIQNLDRALQTLKRAKESQMIPTLERLGVTYGPQYRTFKQLETIQNSIDLDAALAFKNDLHVILDFFDWITQGLSADSDTFDDLEKKMIFAVCKKLGFQV